MSIVPFIPIAIGRNVGSTLRPYGTETLLIGISTDILSLRDKGIINKKYIKLKLHLIKLSITYFNFSLKNAKAILLASWAASSL